MSFIFHERCSDSPFIDRIWRTRSEQAGTFTSLAESHWEMVVTKYDGRTSFTVRGPETKATAAGFPAGAEFLGIVFRPGAFMPHLPVGNLRDRNDVTLPEATNQSFWLLGAAWQIPDYDNVDTFVARLARNDLLTRDPLVEAVLQGHSPDLSRRTIQRRFLRATGLTPKTFQQIERARQAMTLLQQGVPILDAVYETGYYDQSHLTNALKRFTGQTPTQIVESNLPG